MNDTAQATAKSDLPTRFATAILLIAIAAAAIYLNGWAFRILATAAAALMLLEWGQMHRVGRVWIWVAIALTVAALMIGTELGFPAAGGNQFEITHGLLEPALQGIYIIAAAAAIAGILSRRPTLGWAVLYIGIPSYALIVVNWAWLQLSFWVLLIVWATDIFAYFAGRAIGGPRLAPRLSPKKTWAGLAGGIVGAAALGYFAAQALDLDPAFLWLGGPFALLAQIGDLYESGVKRRAGVKDSGDSLPGHGGVLDRLDGMLPVALATLAVLMGLV